MDETQKKRKMTRLVAVLAVMLAVSAAVLAALLTHLPPASAEPVSACAPDNVIAQSGRLVVEAVAPAARPAAQGDVYDGLIHADDPADPPRSSYRASTTLYLYNRNPGDNTPFSVRNMFPGDVETNFYCVRVSCRGPVTVHFRADVRPGYEKLAEVLGCKVVLLTTGETLYDGLMRDMPESLDHALSASAALDYQITAYLDTSVGNEYQNKELIADFRWWVEGDAYSSSDPDGTDDDNLGPWYGLIDPPRTGDDRRPALWLGLAVASLLALVLLLVLLRKKGERHE